MFRLRIETVSKFFRVGTSTPQPQQTDSTITPHTPTSAKSLDYVLEKNQSDLEPDNISVFSMSSFISTTSQKSLPQGDANNKNDELLPEIEILTDQEIASIKLESAEEEQPRDKIDLAPSSANTSVINLMFDSNKQENYRIYIGSIADQSLVNYTVRLIASKFLLFGYPNKCHDDTTVRISIKNSSLTVISYCVLLCPTTLLLTLQKTNEFVEAVLQPQSNSSDSEDSISDSSNGKKTIETNEIECGEQLNIKDDHFGENSKMTSTYFDFFSPLSKSADNILLSQLGATSSQGKSKSNRKLRDDLSELLSKSDIVDSKSSFECTHLLDDTNRLLLESSINMSESQTSDVIEALQLIEDIFLFWNHSDPVLRTNVQLVIGNFLLRILNEHDDIAKFIETSGYGVSYKFLNFNILINLLLSGLTDEVHTVVKQSLSSLEKVLTVLLDHKQNWYLQHDTENRSQDHIKEVASMDFNYIRRVNLLETIFEKVMSVFENKYWVVQNRYCTFVTSMNFDGAVVIMGREKSDEYKVNYSK